MELAAVICAHNPRRDYFSRVLDALRDQTLPKDQWELIIVDNASKVPLALEWDISWHPNGRQMVESELGLAAARRRGMREAACELIVFIDDDNVLNSDYLSEALRIKREWPLLGAWGAGTIIPEFEIEPPDQIRPFLGALALRQVAAPQWTNVFGCGATPWGAGLCMRSSVAAAYYRHCARSALAITGRRGNSLASGEDVEICYVACSMGLGIGIFPNLGITHLIPKQRISADYLVKLRESTNIAEVLLTYKWQGVLPTSPLSIIGGLKALVYILTLRGMERRLYIACLRGTLKAINMITIAASPGSR